MLPLPSHSHFPCGGPNSLASLISFAAPDCGYFSNYYSFQHLLIESVHKSKTSIGVMNKKICTLGRNLQIKQHR